MDTKTGQPLFGNCVAIFGEISVGKLPKIETSLAYQKQVVASFVKTKSNGNRYNQTIKPIVPINIKNRIHFV